MAGIPFWFKTKRRTLTTFWIVQGVAMYAMVTPVTIFFGDKNSVAGSLLRPIAPLAAVVVLSLLQAVFFWPIHRPGAARSGRRLWPSILVGGLMVGVLGFAATMAVSQVLSEDVFKDEPPFFPIALGIMLLAWCIATPLLIAFSRRGPRETFLQRLAARLLMGTIVEAAAIIPLDVLIRRRDDCICATGTYIGLTLCGAVGLFVLGPAVFLPLLMRRRKRWFAGRCEVCGYDMAGCREAERCPECGAGWRITAPAAPSSLVQNDQARSAK